MPVPNGRFEGFLFVVDGISLEEAFIVASGGGTIKDFFAFGARVLKDAGHDVGPALKVVVEDLGNLVERSVLKKHRGVMRSRRRNHLRVS